MSREPGKIQKEDQEDHVNLSVIEPGDPPPAHLLFPSPPGPPGPPSGSSLASLELHQTSLRKALLYSRVTLLMGMSGGFTHLEVAYKAYKITVKSKSQQTTQRQ